MIYQYFHSLTFKQKKELRKIKWTPEAVKKTICLLKNKKDQDIAFSQMLADFKVYPLWDSASMIEQSPWWSSKESSQKFGELIVNFLKNKIN